MFIRFAIPIPKFCVYSSSISFNFLLSLFFSINSLIFIPSIVFKLNSLLIFSFNLLIEEYTSKHPLLPQLHFIPSLFITVWPTSKPEYLLGLNNFPFK